jgi:cell division transport system permease protein
VKPVMIRHSLSESLRSLVRHPLVTLASISTIMLMLVLLGAFSIFSFNARQIMIQAGQQPPVEITMEIGVTQQQVNAVQTALDKHPDVVDYTRYTPEENFDQFKASMENDSLFEDFPVTNIPYTFTVRLTNPDLGKDFQASMSGLPGVRKISLELTVMEFLGRAIVWVNYATLAAFIVLGVISFFIISNMVRVAVFSRGEEISIMKYVGATNWYIRVPYIIEGGLVGLVGALLAWLLTWFAYERIYAVLMTGVEPTDVLAMVSPGIVSQQIIAMNLIIGIGVGALGSAIAVRRHISV